MRGALWLLAHSLKRVRTLVLAMAVLLAAFQVILIVVAKSIDSSNNFEQINAMIPAFAREMVGPSITSIMSFSGFVCLGYFHLSVMISLIALSIALSTTPAGEVESGFMDLILSRPLARHWIITRTIVMMTTCTAAVLGTMMLATWVGLNTLGPRNTTWPSQHLVLSLAGNLALLMLCWSGIAMAIGAAARRRSVAGAVTGVAALATFLLDYVGRVWKPAELAAWGSPFRYYSPFDLVMGTPIPTQNLVVLTAMALAGFALAYLFFARRDISH